MDIKEIEKLKKAVEETYREKVVALKQERDKNIDAIDIVASLTIGATVHIGTPSDSHTVQTVRIKWAEFIREEIRKIKGNFSLATIRDIASLTYPGAEMSRNSFHTVTKAMIRDGEVKMEQRGEGTSPTIYSVVG